MRTPISRTLLTAGAAGALLTVLAGCSAGDDGSAERSPKPSASGSAKSATSSPGPQFFDPPADIEKVTIECKDDVAQVDKSNVDITVPDCAKVVVSASNSVVHLGTVQALVVSGSINDVQAQQVARLSVDGNGNRVTTKGETSNTKDKGAGNTIQTR